MGLKTFLGGVHPYEGKELAKEKEYEKKSPKTDNAFREINIELPIMKSGGINEIGDELYKI